MLASPIFHHSRHICLSLSISFFVTSLSLSLSSTHIRTWRHLLAIPSPSWPSLFRCHPLVFARAASLFRTWLQARPRHISHLHSAQTLVSSLIPTQSPRFHLLPFPPPPPLPANILSRSFDPSQSRTRNLIQNVPNAIHIIILVADNGKFV